MNQHDFVAWAQRQHAEGPDETWEAAHYPLPRGEGNETVLLHHLDHSVQGVFQSEEVGRTCFFSPDTRKALYETPTYWPTGWFEACDLYEKWGARNSALGVQTLMKEKRGWWSEEARQKRVEAVRAARSIPHRVINERLGIDLVFPSLTKAAEFVGSEAKRLRRWRDGINPSRAGWVIKFA